MYLIALFTFTFTADDAAVQPPAQTVVAMISQAEELMEQGEIRQAEKILLKARKEDKKNPKIYRLLGDVNRKLYKHSLANSYYKKAEKLEKNQN